MERFGRAREPFPRRFMTLSHGIASHDAFSDPFNALDPAGLQRVLLRLPEGRASVLENDAIAIDGQSLRRSLAAAASRSPVHPVQAFAAEARLVLGQGKGDGKSNEISAMPKLLETLALKGRTRDRRCDAYPAGDSRGRDGQGRRLCPGAQGQSGAPV